MFIEKITIKNFRSIIDCSFDAKNITVFVGKNDVGKSNILKALNLFFNEETDIGQGFDFDIDYSRFAVVRKKKAKEVIIEILLSPPETFHDYTKKILWTKKWRANGLYAPGGTFVFADGANITDRSRLKVWSDRLRYHYVPAIKSNDYFSSLLKTLYETLYLTIKSDLHNAGQEFIKKIREHTAPLSKELLDRLSLESKIQLPEDLSNLFSTLDFETRSKDKIISLKNRGDGIKVRHLPVILKFLAEKERMHHPRGAVRSDTIWGYEEPENNLELFQAFELANDFENYSNDAQIFLTTHSPAFYTIGKNQSRTIKYSTFNEAANGSTNISIIESSDIEKVDKHMGLLPLVAPYIDEVRKKNEELNNIIEDLKDETKPILFVEGPTDKTILENAWEKLKSKTAMPFRIQQAFDRYFICNTFRRGEIFIKNDKNTFIGMLDFDEAFEDWHRLIEGHPELWKRGELDCKKGLVLKHAKHKAGIFLLPVPDHRIAYASETYGKTSRLSIELLFYDEKLVGYCDDTEIVGGSKIKKLKEDKKAKFAEETKNYSKDDFSCFEPVFNTIDNIIREMKSE